MDRARVSALFKVRLEGAEQDRAFGLADAPCFTSKSCIDLGGEFQIHWAILSAVSA